MESNENTIGEETFIEAEAQKASEHPMDALLEGEAYELETPRRGDIRTGTIARITDSDILVDIGAKSEGVIPTREVEQLPEELRADLEVGKEIEVYVVRSGGRDGTIVLSINRAEEEQDWREAERLLESREAYEGTISGYNKGGLIVKLGRLRGFIPASQVSLSRRRRAEGETPDQRWGEMVGEPIIARVIEVDRRRNRLILSERAAARESRDALKERLIAELELGEVRTGTVISLADFGAFVDIGGADGLVHVSELSWKRVENPRDILKVGQQVQVKILGVDPERKRISLSLRELEPDPWDEIVDGLQEGQLVEGTITKLTKFGAFAALKGTGEYEIEGLIHISELSDSRIEHPREVVHEGQDVAMRLIKIDRERRRIGLSLKRVDSPEYADVDWQSAAAELEREGVEGVALKATDEVEDFDAALEEVAEDVAPEAELPAEEITESEPEASVEEQPESAEAEAEPPVAQAEAMAVESPVEEAEAEEERGGASEVDAPPEAELPPEPDPPESLAETPPEEGGQENS